MMTFECVTIGNATLYCGDSLEIMPTLDPVAHIISDPPYEASLHDSKNKLQTRLRSDKGPDLQGLDFDAIDDIRARVVELAFPMCSGWFVAFCTVEGTYPWSQVINASPMKYKRACIWVKPDSTPQLNGQCPAQGAECFVTAWCGDGHSKWNSGGKRGIYTHFTNTKDRTGKHPTEKPVSLMSEIIADFTAPDDVILDPFMGSGTTGVAALRNGRRFIGIEKSREYFDLACERMSSAESQASLFIPPAKTKLVNAALEF